jgi:hypothetical protein
MSIFARRLVLASMLLPLIQRTAAAHGSLESTLSFFVRSTGIDVQIYMSRGSAGALLDKKPGEQVVILRENFPDFQQRLANSGSGLMTITAADGTALKVESSVASITDEDDICYRLHYPLPTALPGLVTIHGNYLDKLEDGHVGGVYVLNAAGDQLGQGDIRSDSPDFVVQVPAVAAATTTPPPIASTLPVGSLNEPRHVSTRDFWIVTACGAVALAIIVWTGFFRRKNRGNRRA